ncbi:hypothetical protein NT6N_36270 [Oceaniferula spumae]|uniref:Translocation and assembly module TamB C-terminal domain-containing protein n=1 Tax=Oceaniferula spumae TaxID=2979115 RepID=A0AAT9FR09_9BACT
MPDEEFSDSPEESPSKKPRSQRRKIILLIGLLVVCYLVNGPCARWLVHYGLNKALEAQGMTGSSEVTGTLSGGFTIQDLSYTGDQGIQSLKVSEASAHYKFSELFSSKVRGVDLKQSVVVIDLDKFPPSQEEEKSTDTKIKDTLQTLHPWISQPSITITDLDISILKSGVQQAHFNLKSFVHEAESNAFDMHGFVATDREGRTTPEQDVHLVWKPEAASIDRFEVLPDIAVEKVAIDWTSDFKGQGDLKFLAATLNVRVEENVSAKLSDGTINSKELVERFDLELPADFSISELDATVSEWLKPLPEWKIQAHTRLASATYQDYQLENTTLELTQDKQAYQLAVNGTLNTNALSIKADGRWLSPESETWWGHTQASYEVDVPKLGTLIQLIDDLPEGIELKNTAVDAKGNIEVKENEVTQADLEGQITKVAADGVTLPELDLTANYLSNGKSTAKLEAKRNGAIVLQLDADYGIDNKDYQGKLSVTEGDPAWINALARIFKAEVKLEGPVALTWEGKGNATEFNNPEIPQSGTLKLEKLNLILPDTPALNITAEANYNWPESVTLTSLQVKEKDWNGSASLRWDGEIVDIGKVKLTRGGEQVATLNGKLPFQAEIDSAKKFFNQNDEWNLAVKTQPIALKKIQEWFKVDLLNKMTGTTDLDVQLSGTPNNPQIKGSARASDVKGVDDGNLLPLHLSFDFYSENKKLNISGKLLEGDVDRFLLTGTVPFTPSDWINDPDFIDNFISNAPLSAEVKINTLKLGRFKNFIPQLEQLTGTLNGKATLKGTIENPEYLVDLDADVPLIKLKKDGIGDIKNVKLNTKFDQNQKATTKLTALVNGGKFEAGGTVDLRDYKKPVFDLYLRTQFALIHRDDMVSVRANSDIQLKGNMENATISGTVGIAESLFYKDIELIPIGVPSSEVAKVKMPALSKKKSNDTLPIPEPYANWKLNLTVRTDDPVLIRGNVAAGNLSGSIKVGGTLEKPAPSGTILVNEVKAKLPFSILEIKRGEIVFDPKNGLNPTLNIRGKSTIGSYDVSVFVYGSANSPKTAFTSYPPLPESEVMALLATGTTTSGLENQSVATFKAFQVFLLKLQQRNDKPGGNKLFKLLLSGIDDLNLNVGETDPFTGRKFSSATVELHRRWHFTAQVDDTQQTRGLVVYVIRFK